MRKINFFEWIWVNIASVALTFKYSVVALYVCARHSKPRAKIDQVCRQWSHSLLRLIDLRWTVLGAMPILESQRRYIIMCSHASHYDIPLSFVAVEGSMRMLAKNELGKIPVFGHAMRKTEFVFIDRHSKERSLRDLKVAKEKMESGIILWVAPEGTRSRDGNLLPFKKGCFHLALETQAVIIPIVIRDIIKVLPKGDTRPNKGVDVEFVIGDTIDAATYSMSQKHDLSVHVRNVMQSMLDAKKGQVI